MGKKKAKKTTTKSGLLKQLGLTLGIAAIVIVVAVVIINTINKTTIKTITVEGAYSELFIGNPELGSTEIGITVYPETASKSSLVAYSNNPEIATVSFDGEKLTVTAVGVGTTEVVVRHASKSSLYDTMEICVKDVDIQSLTFGTRDEEGVLTAVSAVEVKKDGFEHVIPFDLEPANGNMNNLKISDFNNAVFESVEIDQTRRALIVVPKTDIVQTSAEIDVEIFQNTTEGYSAVQVVSLMVNLKNREAYINFELSSNPSSADGFITLDYKEDKSRSNVIYLENPVQTETKTALDVYVRPIIGYDKAFESKGAFSFVDYDLYYDGVKVEENDFNAQGEYNYKNKLKLTKGLGDYYYFESLADFNEDDAIYVEFLHRYTGASSGIQFIRLDVGTIGLGTSQPFGIYDTDGNICSNGGVIELNSNDVFSLNFTYDVAIDKEIIRIETYKEVAEGNKIERIYTDTFGDTVNDETIKIKKDNKKLSVWTLNLTEDTIINFAAKWNYWDARYVKISPDTNIGISFVINSAVTGLHVERGGLETSLITLGQGGKAEVVLVAEPEGGNFEPERITTSVKLNGAESSDIVVTYAEEKFEIQVKSIAQDGTYVIEFEYDGARTYLYILV